MPTLYQILRMETIGTPPILQGGVPLTYDDPRQAAAMAKEYSKAMGEKLCVKPLVDDEWRTREQKRMMDETYRPLPWIKTGWWNSDRAYAIWKDHFPHASLEKPGWIAYTKTPEDGAKDKQSLLRPGAYLNKYFEKTLDAYGVGERGLVEQFMLMYGPIDIKFAATEEEVIKIYDLVQTCMAGKRWPNKTHPATIYLAGDLQIAYIGDLDKNKVSARTLVWPQKKLHSRIYGDIARLTHGLQRLGYKWGAPIGAKIKRIELHPVDLANGITSQCFLVPYIDKKNQQGGGHLSVMDKGDHLVICEEGLPGSHHAGQAEGTSGMYVPRVDEYPTFTCDRCGEGGLREIFTVYSGIEPDDEDEEAEAGDESHWCYNCRDEYAAQCGYSGYHFDRDNAVMVQVGGRDWWKKYADMYARKCEGSGLLYPAADLRRIHFPDGTSKWLSMPYINDHIGKVYRSDLTRNYFPANELAYVFINGDRHVCSKAELKIRAFQCDGCDQHWSVEDRHQHFDDDRLFCPTCVIRMARGGPAPVSPSRKLFEEARQQPHLIAAE